MLLELQNTSTDDVRKLLAFAQQNNLQLSVVDDDFNNYHLPGKPLTASQLDELVSNSRKSGTISLQDAHEIIRSNLHGN